MKKYFQKFSSVQEPKLWCDLHMLPHVTGATFRIMVEVRIFNGFGCSWTSCIQDDLKPHFGRRTTVPPKNWQYS